MGVALATARPLHFDINVWDPIWTAPSHVEVTRLLGGAPLELLGYPLHMVHVPVPDCGPRRGRGTDPLGTSGTPRVCPATTAVRP